MNRTIGWISFALVAMLAIPMVLEGSFDQKARDLSVEMQGRAAINTQISMKGASAMDSSGLDAIRTVAQGIGHSMAPAAPEKSGTIQ